MRGIDVVTPGEAIDYNDSAGYRLRCAREQLSLSIRDVASPLNLLVNHVRAIEANRYNALVDDEQFLRHLHDYASLVDLDAEEIEDVYRTQSAAISEEVQPQPTENKKRHASEWVGVGALAFVCVCLGMWLLNQILQSESSNTAMLRNEVTENSQSNTQQLPTNDQIARNTRVENASPADRLSPGAANAVSVAAAIDDRKETLTSGKKNTSTGDETRGRSDQAVFESIQEQPTEGAVSSAITHTDPANGNLGKNTLLDVGAAPLVAFKTRLAPAPTSTNPMQTGATTKLRSAEWFASLDPDRYTLQILSLTKEENSRAFIQSRHLEDQAAYFSIRNDDQKTWYAVTYGLYDSFDAAESASKSLPDSIKDFKPMVRNTGRIQRIMLR